MKLIRIFIPLFTGTLLYVTTFAVPLSGVYTIGGTSPNYTTFTAAVNDLNNLGVSSPVTFNVRAGTYSEQIIINGYSGASAANTVTFQSESGVNSDVTITYTATGTGDNYVVYLSGASYVTIRNLTITAVGATYAKSLKLDNSAVHDSIINNILNCGTSSYGVNTSMVIDAYGGSNNDYLVFNGNQVNGGSYAFQMEGGSAVGLEITNNTFTNNAYMAIDLNGCKCAMIRGNTINNPSFGIMIWDGCDGVRVLNNNITAPYGLYIPSAGVPGNEGLIANNFFYSTEYAIYGINTTNQFFYNNSVIITSAGGYAIYMYGGCSANVLKNNIFYNSAGGDAVSISPAGAISTSDYNDYYTSGSTLGVMNGISYSNLAALQAGNSSDTHSAFLLPPFTSASDLHLTAYTSMRFGIAIGAVPIDIDYTLRGTNPTVGADDTGSVISMYDVSSCCGCTQVAFTANVTTVCSGSEVQFTDQTGGSAIAWNWSFPGGTPGSSISSTPLITYDTSGTYNVTLIVTTTIGNDTLTKTAYITVNGLPAVGVITANPDSICSGDSSLLTTTGSARTIQWQSSITSSNFTDISGANDTVYNTSALLQTTNYRLVATNGSCADTSASLTIVVNPSPTPPALSTADSLICASDSTLINTSSSYSSYLWNDSDTHSFTYATGASGAGGYWVTVADANGCTAVSNHQYINVYPIPSVSITVQGDTLSSFGAVSYQWFLNNDSIPGATMPVYIASQTGSYSVEVTDTNGCRALSTSTQVTITGVSQLEGSSSWTIYPDPFTNTIFIKGNGMATNTGDVEVYDVLGETVLSKKEIEFSSNPQPLNVSTLPAGMYFVVVRCANTEQLGKLVKE